ncbi:MAG TPA: TolC family protein [Acidobacteriaceae bacterium]|nr:TolC family protein [Acidobacteriaceae bacterium]
MTGIFRKINTLWLIAVAMLLVAPARQTAIAQNVQAAPLTLRQAIAIALDKNPNAAEAQAGVKEAQAGVRQARTGLFPRLNFSENISRGNDPVYAFGTRLRQQRFSQSDFALNALNRPSPIGNFATEASGSWMLFNWFGTQNQIKSAKFAAASAASMSNEANQGIVLGVVQAYQSVLYAERQIDVARHEAATAQALLNDAKTRVKAGLAVDSDMLSAQVNLSERQQELIAAEGNADAAWAALQAAMGVDNLPASTLKPLQAQNYPDGVLADDIASALKARPDLKALRQQQTAQQSAVSAARADFYPTVSTYGNWETDRDTFAGDGGNHWVAGVQLNIDILPLGKRAHLMQQQAAQQKASAQERAGAQQIRLAVSQAWTQHRTAERMVQTAQASMKQSAESLRIVRNRYRAGLATITDMLHAEDAQRRSQNDYWRAAYQNTVAYAELLYATGTLTPNSAENLQ